MKLVRVIVLLMVIGLMFGQNIFSSHAASKIKVIWGIGFGTGTQSEMVDAEQKIIENFNNSQNEIEVSLVFYFMGALTGRDRLDDSIRSGHPPDIFGPSSVRDTNFDYQLWLDLRPYVDKTGYSLDQYPKSVVSLFDGDRGLVGLPFAAYPGMIFYNTELFDAAGLAYPPTRFGEKYILDGKTVEWNYDTIAEVSKRLTLDAQGYRANSPNFNPDHIIQYGFIHQWSTIRSDFSTFGGASVFDSATGKITIPDHWRAEAQWLWNGIWKDHFIPDTKASEVLQPNVFASGKVAMARVMSWYTYWLSEAKFKWDLAVVPMYQGQYYAPADADTFHIMKSSKHPDAAFTVLQYLLGEAAPELLALYYEATPARPDLQKAYQQRLSKQFPFVKHWDVMPLSLPYAVLPHQESYYPGFSYTDMKNDPPFLPVLTSKGERRFAAFRDLLYGDSGKNINVNEELDKLQSDLQIIAVGSQATVTPTTIPQTPFRRP